MFAKLIDDSSEFLVKLLLSLISCGLTMTLKMIKMLHKISFGSSYRSPHEDSSVLSYKIIVNLKNHQQFHVSTSQSATPLQWLVNGIHFKGVSQSNSWYLHFVVKPFDICRKTNKIKIILIIMIFDLKYSRKAMCSARFTKFNWNCDNSWFCLLIIITFTRK